MESEKLYKIKQSRLPEITVKKMVVEDFNRSEGAMIRGGIWSSIPVETDSIPELITTLTQIHKDWKEANEIPKT